MRLLTGGKGRGILLIFKFSIGLHEFCTYIFVSSESLKYCVWLEKNENSQIGQSATLHST